MMNFKKSYYILLFLILLGIFYSIIFLNLSPSALVLLFVIYGILLLGLPLIIHNKYKKFFDTNKNIINIITSSWLALFILASFVMTYHTYRVNEEISKIYKETYELALDANKAKLAVQLVTSEIFWGHYLENYDIYLTNWELNQTYLKIPIYLTINNYGSIPTQIYNVIWETKCGNNSGFFPIPTNSSTLIKPGDFYRMVDDILVHSKYINNTAKIKDILPCKVDFWIGGPNFDTIKKTITLKESGK